MNRAEFMKELEERLVNVQEEERKEALQYYNDYFDDAGEENEETVIQNLGSPETLAKSIQADLNKGEFTEKGYQMGEDSNPYKVVQAAEQQKSNEDSYSSAWTDNKEEKNSNSGSNNNNNSDRGYYNNANHERNYNHDYEHRDVRKPQRSGISTALLILICVFALPIALPLFFALLGVVLGIGGALFGVIVGFGGAGIACMFAGFVLVVAGITKIILVPATGLVIVGGGCLVFGIGLLLFMLTMSIAKLLPALFRAFINICKAPFRGRSVTA